MAEFILKNNFFEFETKIIQQISETTIGTRFAPPYARLFMDRSDNEFFDSEIVGVVGVKVYKCCIFHLDRK